MKQTLLQYFEWYTPNDGKLYTHLKKQASQLRDLGITKIWMPPACKGFTGKNDVGYGVYDLYDLGEFRQKGSIRTKYGNLKQYLEAIEALHTCQIEVLADIVFDHRMGADKAEKVLVSKVNPTNRNETIGAPFYANVYTKFTFPGRKGRYSDFKWDWHCFKGIDGTEKGLVLFQGKHWDQDVSQEMGNFDYIMGTDVDVHNPMVKEELYRWGIWMIYKTGIDGFRLDAIKSISASFFPGWLQTMRKAKGKNAFAVGEYWSGNLGELCHYLDQVGFCMSLFDVPLHYHFFDLSHSSGTGDVWRLNDGTLSQIHPHSAVVFVDNHDTQPGQALQSWVMDWFKTSAYAWILLRCYEMPCVFLADLIGSKTAQTPAVSMLAQLIWLRSHLLSDQIIDLFDSDPQKACWISLCEHPILVLFSIGDAKRKSIHFPELAGMELVDITRLNHSVHFNEEGKCEIDCAPGCCSVYIRHEDALWMKRAMGRHIKDFR